MSEKKRLLKSLDISFISLVDKGANQKTILYKSADANNDGQFNRTVNIAKVNEDQHEVIGIVYEPDTPDSDGDWTTADVIKDAEYRFMKNKNTGNVDQQHDLVGDKGFIAESWIIQKNDVRLPDAKEGSWAVVIKVENEEVWGQIKSGDITGLSMYGMAVVDEIQKAASGGDMPTKTEGGNKYPSEAYAYVPDPEKPSTWKLRLWESPDVKMSAKQIGMAVAAFSPGGNRGNKVEIPEGDLAAVKSKIRSAWKKVNPDKKPNEMPAYIKKENIFTKVMDKIISLRKDFNSQWSEDQLRRMSYSLTDSISEVLHDENVTDKKQAILDNVDQFRSVVEEMNISATISKSNFNNQNEVNEMTDIEITQLVKSTIDEALKPISENILKMKTEVNEKASGFEQRLDKVEKSTPGSAKENIPGEVKKAAGDTYAGPPWLS